MSDFRPFCVGMDNATKDDIRKLHQMCLDAGQKEQESCDYWIANRYNYHFMGVDHCMHITSYYYSSNFEGNILTLNQVSEHLASTTPDNDSVTSKPVKWTKAMQEEGTPLTVGMLALDDIGEIVEVNYEGANNFTVTYIETKSEDLWGKSVLSPFPDEETHEQVNQRKEFLSTFQGFLNDDPYVYEGDGVAEDMYDKLKHMFKY